MDGDLQRTERWHSERAGCFTASCFGELAWAQEKFKTGPKAGQWKPAPKSRTNYIAQVAAEILTGTAKAGVTARALEWVGLLDRWSRFRANWFFPDARGALVLLALWPVALLFPAPVPLGLGQVLERAEDALALWLQEIGRAHV
mgnify:CR=1 FL=1